MRFGFVIPTYNRAENLTLCLEGLLHQTNRDFDVVVWDDGSEDDTRKTVVDYSNRLPIIYGWNPHQGYRVSLARNCGARLHDSKVTHFWFIDSDVVLNPKAIEHAYDLCNRQRKTTICGRYDWLPPMEIRPSQIGDHFEDFAAGSLMRKDVDYVQDILGPDPRVRTDPELWDCTKKVTVFGGATLSGNLIVPYYWFNETGGFDENIVGQGQDAEFGYHLQALGASVVFCPHIIGYHVSHYIDRAWKTKSVRDTISYICKKYNLPFAEEELPV